VPFNQRYENDPLPALACARQVIVLLILTGFGVAEQEAVIGW
jgi:hypothetical protein